MTRHAFILPVLIMLAACAQVPAAPTPEQSSTRAGTPIPLPSPSATLALPTPSPTEPAPSLALVNATLIDGTGAAPVTGAVIVIREGRIAGVGSGDQVVIPANAQAIDLQGATVLPGFINAHVHEAYNAEHLRAWAMAGVTTVRDLSIRVSSPEGVAAYYDRRQTEFAQPEFARVISASPMLTAPDGGYGAMPITSVEDARAKVDQLLDRGANLIKISLEDNLMNRTWTRMPLEHAKAIVAAAHARGVPVSAHISRPYQVEWALDVGVDDLSHMVIDPLPDELIPRLVASNMYWTPTMELWYGVGAGGRADRNLSRFADAGGKIALGTDYAGYTIQFDLGMPIHELAYMQAAGMTPMQTLVAATKHAAHVCNREQDLGTLEVGKIADILVVNGNPLSDLRALLNVRLVMHNGVIIRNELGSDR